MFDRRLYTTHVYLLSCCFYTVLKNRRLVINRMTLNADKAEAPQGLICYLGEREWLLSFNGANTLFAEIFEVYL